MTKRKRYTATINLPNGQRKWIRAATKEELEQKKTKLAIQLNAGVDVQDNSTFRTFSEIWLASCKEPYLRDNSLYVIRNALDKHILPYLGEHPVKKILPMHVQNVMAKLTQSSNTLNKQVLQTMRGIFNTAVDNQLIARSPVPIGLKAVGTATEEKVPLTPMQEKQLLAAIEGTRAYLFCLIALNTGMRRGEIAGLMWSDVDFEHKEIHVRHNAVLLDEKTSVSEDLKTKNAKRDIPMPTVLLRVLKEEHAQSSSVFVVAGTGGKPMTRSSITKLMKLIETRTTDDPAKLGKPVDPKHPNVLYGIDFHVTAHLLRHTYITRLFEAGLDIKQIQYLAGHATVEMTLGTYTHYQAESRKNETANQIRAALG